MNNFTMPLTEGTFSFETAGLKIVNVNIMEVFGLYVATVVDGTIEGKAQAAYLEYVGEGMLQAKFNLFLGGDTHDPDPGRRAEFLYQVGMWGSLIFSGSFFFRVFKYVY